MSLRQAGWVGFFMLAFTDFVALNSDFLIVGHIDEAASLGLYSLAFTLAFAPLTQVSWQVGRVLFPAAAATVDLATVARRTLVSVRMMGLILLPFVPPAIVLAPVVLPGLLGDEWKAMVAPFQILLVVGVGQAMVGMIGESLSGTGNIGWRARVNAVWAAGMVGALIVLVSADGIRGRPGPTRRCSCRWPWRTARWGRGRSAWMGAGSCRRSFRSWCHSRCSAWSRSESRRCCETAGIEDGWAAVAGAVVGVVALVVVLLRLPSSPLSEGRAVLADARGVT